MKDLIQKFLKWLDARAAKDAMYADYIAAHKGIAGAY